MRSMQRYLLACVMSNCSRVVFVVSMRVVSNSTLIPVHEYHNLAVGSSHQFNQLGRGGSSSLIVEPEKTVGYRTWTGIKYEVTDGASKNKAILLCSCVDALADVRRCTFSFTAGAEFVRLATNKNRTVVYPQTKHLYHSHSSSSCLAFFLGGVRNDGGARKWPHLGAD